MYQRILVPVEHSDNDEVILGHVRKLARTCNDASIAILAGGDPAKEIAECADREKCDLIAMATHGHRGLADVLWGTVASEVRHISMVPVLMVRGHPPSHPFSRPTS
jgi:nucleotide-binding universal stress UspA family protein